MLPHVSIHSQLDVVRDVIGKKSSVWFVMINREQSTRAQVLTVDKMQTL